MAFSLKRLFKGLIILLIIFALLVIIGANTFAKVSSPQGSIGDTFLGSSIIIGIILMTSIILVSFIIAREVESRVPWYLKTRPVKWAIKSYGAYKAKSYLKENGLGFLIVIEDFFRGFFRFFFY